MHDEVNINQMTLNLWLVITAVLMVIPHVKHLFLGNYFDYTLHLYWKMKQMTKKGGRGGNWWVNLVHRSWVLDRPPPTGCAALSTALSAKPWCTYVYIVDFIKSTNILSPTSVPCSKAWWLEHAYYAPRHLQGAKFVHVRRGCGSDDRVGVAYLTGIYKLQSVDGGGMQSVLAHTCRRWDSLKLGGGHDARRQSITKI